jgi:glyoxylase-like metal-dependent hydrolase (beta-lactamase superfamily II)
MRIFALTCGWVTGDAGGFLAGATGRLRVPVPCFLVEHPRGLVLFDSGLHPGVATDPARHLGWLASVFDVELGADDGVAARLRALGHAPEAVRWLVTSHLHFDHVGGHASIPDATLVVQRAEWEAGRDGERARRLGFDPANYDLGHAVRLVDGAHDLFGDGRIVCVPTPGHTPGHQSLQLRTDDGREILLTADACYLRRTLEERRLPPLAWDLDAMRSSLDRLAARRDAGATLVFGHDPAEWAAMPQAPRPLA